MNRFLLLTLLLSGLTTRTLAGPGADSLIQARFRTLADKLDLKPPKPRQDEYEVRIWNKQALLFGDAQMLYVLKKIKRRLTLTKYDIYSDQHGFQRAIRIKPAVAPDDSLWARLVRDDLLTLPDGSAIWEQLRPKPWKDSTWTMMEANGSVSVKAKRREGGVIIADGERYIFEVFGANNYRQSSYSNPRDYLRYKPNIVELKKVVAILDEMAVSFRK